MREAYLGPQCPRNNPPHCCTCALVGDVELRRACAAAQAEALRLYDCSPDNDAA